MGSSVAFRVDASPAIGIGHFMRCLSLADAMAARHTEIRFVCRHLSPSLRDLLFARGYSLAMTRGTLPVEPLDELAHADWLGTSQQADAAATIQALAGRKWDWIVIDHYALDTRWETPLRAVVKHVLAIDDVADRPHVCDILLDQNYYVDMETRYRGRLAPATRALLGPHYSLLRADFARRRATLQPRSGRLARLLICFGGIDQHDYTSMALEAVRCAALTGTTVEVVIGASHPNRENIVSLCAERGITCHVQTDRMSDVMADADLAFGASGSTSWERCCLALPTICVATAHNQVAIGRGLEAAGAVILVGDREAVAVDTLLAALRSLAAAPDRLRAMSDAAARLVDGRGADRVCDAMLRVA